MSWTLGPSSGQYLLTDSSTLRDYDFVSSAPCYLLFIEDGGELCLHI